MTSRPSRHLRPSAGHPSRSFSVHPLIADIASTLMVLWGTTLATFVMLNALPGDAAQVRLGPSGSSAEQSALAAQLGLNEPLRQRYLHWLADLLRGRLGESLATGQPVAALVAQRLPVSVELVVLTLAVSIGCAVPVALGCALRPDGLLDRAVTAVSVAAVSLTPFVLGIGLILAFAVAHDWFPAMGFVLAEQSVAGNLRSLALPVATLALPLSATYTRLLRSDLVDQLLQEDYILAARATGASPWRVLTRHALRNALFGSSAFLALSVGTLLGGTVIAEQVFGLPGMGSSLLQAVNSRDTNVVETIVLLLAIAVLLANRIAERSYRVLDRRLPTRHSA